MLLRPPCSTRTDPLCPDPTLFRSVCRVERVEDGELPALLLGDRAGGEHEALVVAVVVRVTRAEHTDLHGAVTVYIGLVGGHAALLTDARLAVVARGLRRTVIAGRGVVIIVPASGGDERQREARCHPPQLVSLHLRSPNLLGHPCNGRAYLIWWTLTPSR